jgi:hypothetical protein
MATAPSTTAAEVNNMTTDNHSGLRDEEAGEAGLGRAVSEEAQLADVSFSLLLWLLLLLLRLLGGDGDGGDCGEGSRL